MLAREAMLRDKTERIERADDRRNILIGGVGLFLFAITLVKGVPVLEDALYDADISALGGFFDPFDFVAAMFWSVPLCILQHSDD